MLRSTTGLTQRNLETYTYTFSSFLYPVVYFYIASPLAKLRIAQCKNLLQGFAARKAGAFRAGLFHMIMSNNTCHILDTEGHYTYIDKGVNPVVDFGIAPPAQPRFTRMLMLR